MKVMEVFLLFMINLIFHKVLTAESNCAQLLSNGDFEKPSSNNRDIPGWMETYSDSNPSRIFLVPSRSQKWGNRELAPSGNFYIAVQSSDCNAERHIQQTVHDIPQSLVGSSLLLSFFASGRIDSIKSSTSITVSLNDHSFSTIPLNRHFQYTSVVTPIITSTTLKLKILDNSSASTVDCSDHTFLLDKLSLIPQGCEYPSSTSQSKSPTLSPLKTIRHHPTVAPKTTIPRKSSPTNWKPFNSPTVYKPNPSPTLFPIYFYPIATPASAPRIHPPSRKPSGLQCPDGYYLSRETDTYCSVCPAGHFSSSGDNYCRQCESGYYAPWAGSSFCLHCPRGSATNADRGATSCSVLQGPAPEAEGGTQAGSEQWETLSIALFVLSSAVLLVGIVVCCYKLRQVRYLADNSVF